MTSSPNLPEPSDDNKATKPLIATFPLGRLVLGGVLVIGLVATVILASRGTNICLLSNCGQPPQPTLIPDFWAFAGGAAAFFITIYLGLPLLPAVGIAAGAWFLMYGTLHLG